MIRITFNPLNLIKLILKIAGIGLCLFLIINIIPSKKYISGESAYQVEILKKRGSISDNTQSFKVVDVETGRKASLHPTKSWFGTARVGDIVNVTLDNSDFHQFKVFLHIVGWLCLIMWGIVGMITAITWISENYDRLDKDFDIELKRPSFDSPLKFSKIKVHK